MIILILKSTVALLLALFAARSLKRSRASLRHLVLASLFVFLLLLPLVQQLAPHFDIVLPESPALPNVVKAVANGNSAIIPAGALSNRHEANELSASDIAFRVYAAGVVLLFAWLALGILRLRGLANDGEVWLQGTATMNAMAKDAGIRRAALVILSATVDVPLTFGFRRSTIVLPFAAKSWSGEELARALRHELEHVRREDWFLQILARAAFALYWPHPLVWVAWRRFCLEAERACDDAVVGTHPPDVYAGQLVSLARSLRRMTTVPALAMAGRGRLANRIHAILDPLQRRGPHGPAAAVAALVVMLALLVSVAPTRLIFAAVDNNDLDRHVARWSRIGEILTEAAEDGQIDIVRHYLDGGIDVNTVAEGDGTALIGAARGGQVEMVRFLIKRGADVNLESLGDGNPLIAAAATGRLEIVEILLDEGAHIDEVVLGDENPLIQAAGNGHEDVVRLLLQRGADVNVRVYADRRELRTPLRMAKRSGHEEIVRILIDAGARD